MKLSTQINLGLLVLILTVGAGASFLEIEQTKWHIHDKDATALGAHITSEHPPT